MIEQVTRPRALHDDLKAELLAWVKEIVPPHERVENCVFPVKPNDTGDGSEQLPQLLFWTNAHQFTIIALEGDDGSTRLRCIANSRLAPLASARVEGIDLHEGILCRDTWDAIKNAIIGCEMVKPWTSGEP